MFFKNWLKAIIAGFVVDVALAVIARLFFGWHFSVGPALIFGPLALLASFYFSKTFLKVIILWAIIPIIFVILGAIIKILKIKN